MPSKARQTKIQKNKTEPKNAQFWGLKAWSHALGPPGSALTGVSNWANYTNFAQKAYLRESLTLAHSPN